MGKKISLKNIFYIITIIVTVSSCANQQPISSYTVNQPPLDTRKYFLVTEECYGGKRVGDKDRYFQPCEYFMVLGYTTHSNATYQQISIGDSQYFIDDQHGQIVWGTANIDYYCKRAQEQAKASTTNEPGPFLFDIKELKKSNGDREFEIYSQKNSERYFVLENNCTYNSEMRFKCKDENTNYANYYIPGVTPPNKFNIAEYQYFGKFTEKAFYGELDRLAKIKWEADQKVQQEAENKRLRVEKEKEKARLQKEQEKKQKEEEIRLAKLDSLRSAGCPIALENWSWSRSSEAHITISGKVMNLTEGRITHVKVHVEIYDKGGNFITSGWSYLQYQVLMPYQSSPFQIIERWNPLMAKASVRVQLPTGEMIQGSCSIGK